MGRRDGARIPQKPLASVARTVRERLGGLPEGGVLAAVSGGADSTALALCLKAGGWLGGIAHLNHGLRGEAAAADAAWVEQLAGALDVPYRGGMAEVGKERRKGESVEMAARRVRRAFLEESAKELGLGVVATGHTADDQAETVLLRVLKGTSVEGLAGIGCRGELEGGVPVVRPLLDTWRTEIERWLRLYGWSWRTDATNADGFALRNRIRNVVLPVVRREVNPRVGEALVRLAEIARAEVAGEELGRARRRGVRRVKGRPDFGSVTRAVEAELTERLQEGAAEVWMAPSSSLSDGEPKGVRPGMDELELWRCEEGRIVARTGIGWTEGDGCVYLSLSALAGKGLEIRRVRAGDRIQLHGCGTKKVSDLLRELKVPRAVRARALVATVDGEIAACLPARVAEDFEVAPGAESLRLEWEKTV